MRVPGFSAAAALPPAASQYRSIGRAAEPGGVLTLAQNARAPVPDDATTIGDATSATQTCTCPCCFTWHGRLVCC